MLQSFLDYEHWKGKKEWIKLKKEIHYLIGLVINNSNTNCTYRYTIKIKRYEAIPI